jgi:hypothetical protein
MLFLLLGICTVEGRVTVKLILSPPERLQVACFMLGALMATLWLVPSTMVEQVAREMHPTEAITRVIALNGRDSNIVNSGVSARFVSFM